jgi:hypothetical protein
MEVHYARPLFIEDPRKRSGGIAVAFSVEICYSGDGIDRESPHPESLVHIRAIGFRGRGYQG